MSTHQPAPDAPACGHPDPANEAPWAMQLVVRLEKSDPPAHQDVLAAAGTAVARLLSDERATSTWAPAVTRWRSGRIRKVTRRARAGAWAATGLLEHVEATVGSATVRAFVPGPTDQVPSTLAKLQVAGLDLRESLTEPAPEPVARPLVQIGVNASVPMTTGKAAAQVGHAAQLALETMIAREPARAAAWVAAGCPVSVQARPFQVGDVVKIVVTDAGFTEIPAGSRTATASW